MAAIDPITSAGKAPVDKEDAKLRKACQDFEALLISQMLKAMRETVPKNELFGSREKEEIFQGMLDQELAGQMAKTGSLNLAKLMYAQLSHLAKPKDGEDR